MDGRLWRICIIWAKGNDIDRFDALVQAFAAHRQAAFNAGRASAVEWLRDDANMTEIEARRILGNLVNLTPADTDDWAKLILMKHGIADALERLP